jgi:hypothetical protein
VKYELAHKSQSSSEGCKMIQRFVQLVGGDIVPRATNALRQLRESYFATYLRFGGNHVK